MTLNIFKKYYHLVKIYSNNNDFNNKEYIIKYKNDDKIVDFMYELSNIFGSAQGFDFINSYDIKPKGVETISFKKFIELF